MDYCRFAWAFVILYWYINARCAKKHVQNIKFHALANGVWTNLFDKWNIVFLQERKSSYHIATEASSSKIVDVSYWKRGACYFSEVQNAIPELRDSIEEIVKLTQGNCSKLQVDASHYISHKTLNVSSVAKRLTKDQISYSYHHGTHSELSLNKDIRVVSMLFLIDNWNFSAIGFIISDDRYRPQISVGPTLSELR